MRRFEIVNDNHIQYGVKDIIMPRRSTKSSAGYDFYSPVDIVIEPGASELIWTNVKAQFNDDEVLILSSRSSFSKYNVVLANAIGVIDADYYENVANDGNIAFRYYNYGKEPYKINKGEKIGQGVFLKYLTVDDEIPPSQERVGGFGSTGK